MVSTDYPKLTLVALADVAEALPELMRRRTKGERIVITDGEKWLAEIRPAPPTPAEIEAEEAEARIRAKAAVRRMLDRHLAEMPILNDGTRIQDLIDKLESTE